MVITETIGAEFLVGSSVITVVDVRGSTVVLRIDGDDAVLRSRQLEAAVWPEDVNLPTLERARRASLLGRRRSAGR